MSVDALKAECLYVFVFGPSRGESVVIRVPPDTWIVVDGCRIKQQSAPAALLARHAARWSAVLLTHRHQDHADGLAEVFEGAGEGLIGATGMRAPDEPTTSDPKEHVSSAAVRRVVKVIEDMWHSSGESRWDTYVGEDRGIGAARLQVLHPVRGTGPVDGTDENRMSSAILLLWNELRLLLGGDVVHADWESICSLFPGLAAHHGLKVPHHGSLGAIHDGFARGKLGRYWVVSPWKARKMLPCFDDGDGMEALLRHVGIVRLTGLPVAHSGQQESPCYTTRAAWRDGRSPAPIRSQKFDSVTITWAPEVTSPFYNYIGIGFDRAGDVVDQRFGPGSVVVAESEDELKLCNPLPEKKLRATGAR